MSVIMAQAKKNHISTKKNEYFALLLVLILSILNVSESRYVDTHRFAEYGTTGKHANTRTTENVRASEQSKEYMPIPTEKLLHNSHENDSVCRTMHKDDKLALLNIQGATNEILKVIDRMNIEARPSSPVSAFVKIPKRQKKLTTQELKNTLIKQLPNKEGFTISYDDKKSLEQIKVASEYIINQLLHMDIEERSTKPRPVSSSSKQLNTSASQMIQDPHNMRSQRALEQDTQYLEQDGFRPELGKTQFSHNSNTKTSKQAVHLQNTLKVIDTKVDDIGRSLREEYIDNTNLERTDIKSVSDTVKKLQGMIAGTNRTLLQQLHKILAEQTDMNHLLETKLGTVEDTLIKIFDNSAEMRENPLDGSNKVNRQAKSAEEENDDQDDKDIPDDENDSNEEDVEADDESEISSPDYFTEK